MELLRLLEFALPLLKLKFRASDEPLFLSLPGLIKDRPPGDDPERVRLPE